MQSSSVDANGNEGKTARDWPVIRREEQEDYQPLEAHPRRRRHVGASPHVTEPDEQSAYFASADTDVASRH